MYLIAPACGVLMQQQTCKRCAMSGTEPAKHRRAQAITAAGRAAGASAWAGLAEVSLVAVDGAIAAAVARLRARYRLKLPDAI